MVTTEEIKELEKTEQEMLKHISALQEEIYRLEYECTESSIDEDLGDKQHTIYYLTDECLSLEAELEDILWELHSLKKTMKIVRF